MSCSCHRMNHLADQYKLVSDHLSSHIPLHLLVNGFPKMTNLIFVRVLCLNGWDLVLDKSNQVYLGSVFFLSSLKVSLVITTHIFSCPSGTTRATSSFECLQHYRVLFCVGCPLIFIFHHFQQNDIQTYDATSTKSSCSKAYLIIFFLLFLVGPSGAQGRI